MQSIVYAKNTKNSEDNVIEEVIVTESRLENFDLSDIESVSILNQKSLTHISHPTIEDLLQNLPQVSGADFGSSFNNENPGYATASLRGLGPNRTLILVDGHRLVTAGIKGFVDLNMIPKAIIERIKVSTDGASSVYGSDAIAGVINIITKKQFEGLSTDFQYDITDKNDGEQYSIDALYGTQFDRGNIVLSTQYTHRSAIRQRGRDFSECVQAELNGQVVCRGSGTTYPAHIFPSTANGSWIVDAETGTLRRFNNGDTYNSAAINHMVTPQSVLNAYATINYALLEDSWIGPVNLSLNTLFSTRKSAQLMAPTGTSWGPLVPESHPDNPFGEDVYVARRLSEADSRRNKQNADARNITLALHGELNDNWYWELSYTNGRWHQTRHEHNRVNESRLQTLLDPIACASDSDCPGVWNPFIRDSFTAEMMNYGLVTEKLVSHNQLHHYQLNTGGHLGNLRITEQPIQWVVGYSYHTEDAYFIPDPNTNQEQTKGSHRTNSLYGKIRLPLLQHHPFAESLTIELSGRHFDYNNGDATDTTTKVALEWVPIEGIHFRTARSEGFRNPTIEEQFAAQSTTNATYTDPCSNWGASTNTTIRENCSTDGLPPDFSLTSSKAESIKGGNPDLRPELSETFTLGVTLSPSWLSEFSIALDYFTIEVDNAIGSIGTDNIITGCCQSVDFSDPLCALITGPEAVDRAPSPTSPRRDVLQNIAGPVLTENNLASISTSGFDYSVNYAFGLLSGRVELGLADTYLSSYEYSTFPGAGKKTLAGKFGTDPYQAAIPAAFPKWKQNLTTAYRRDNWGVTWTTHYLGSVTDINANASNYEDTIDAHLTHDIEVNYHLDKVNFTLGIRNLTDKAPPYVTNYGSMNTINVNYDTAGRYLYSRISMNF